MLLDVNRLLAQLSLSKVPPKPLTLPMFKAMLSQPDLHLLAAIVGDGRNEKIIGILSIYFVRIPSGLIAWAEDLLVDQPYRKWGIGRLLMEKGIELARELRARHISLRTNPKRVEANKLYQAVGFQRMETNFYRINLFK